MIILAKLMYQNNIVAYRIQVKGIIFDIDAEDFEILYYELGDDNVADSKIILELHRFGDMLLTSETDEIPSKTYQEVQKLLFYGDKEKISDKDLKKAYIYFNKLLFDNKCPHDMVVHWTTKMTSAAGKCKVRRKGDSYTAFIIKLSVPYHKKFPEHTYSTLVHEMIHAYYPKDTHGYYFKSKMYEINNKKIPNVNISIYAEERAVINYIIECTGCGKRGSSTNIRRNLHNRRCAYCHNELIQYKAPNIDEDDDYGGSDD